jgi:Tfp pilus assembly protein PilN
VRAVNLIPPERRTGASVGLGHSQGGAYALLALVGAVALLVLLYGSARHKVTSSHAQAEKLNAEVTQAQNDATGLAHYNSVIAESQARTQAVEQLIDTRFDWARAYHELGRVLPKQVSISSLTGTIGSENGAVAKSPSASSSPSAPSSASSSSASGGSGGAGSGASGATASAASSVSSATPPGSVPTFTLTGCAASQQTVADMLARIRLAEGVKEATLQSSVSAVNGTGGGAGVCPGNAPTFTVSVMFQPMPAAAPKATATVSDTTAGAPAEATGGSK